MLHKMFVSLGLGTLTLGLTLSTGCMTMLDGSTRERALTAAREYNDGIRWGRWNEVAKQIEPAHRESFVERHERLDDELEFVDYEILSVTVKQPTEKDKRKDTEVLARVHYDWTLKSRGLIQHTDTEQKWKDVHGTFVLVEEVRTKGSPLTCFDEKLPVKSTETAAAATVVSTAPPTGAAQ